MFTNTFETYHPTHSRSPKTFKAIVGCSADIASFIWVKYLLVGSSLYPKNDIATAGQWGVSDRNFFPKVWNLANFLYQDINEVHWEDRFQDMANGGFFANVTTVIDTTECPIATTFNALYSGYKKYFSLKYELGCAIGTGILVWAPLPGCLGPQADQDVLHSYRIYDKMLEGELYLGDGHYAGEPNSRIRFSDEMTKDAQHVRAIIEHVNGKIKKNWGALDSRWRHGISKHHIMFKICVHVQNIMFHEKPPHKIPNPRLWENKGA